MKLVNIKMQIDNLFEKVMSLTQMKIELVEKLSHSTEISLAGLEDILERKTESTDSTASREAEENEIKIEMKNIRKEIKMEIKKEIKKEEKKNSSLKIKVQIICGSCKTENKKWKVVKCSNQNVKNVFLKHI